MVIHRSGGVRAQVVVAGYRGVIVHWIRSGNFFQSTWTKCVYILSGGSSEDVENIFVEDDVEGDRATRIVYVP